MPRISETPREVARLRGVLQELKQEAERALERPSPAALRSDPGVWIRKLTGESPWTAQLEILRAALTKRRVAVRTGFALGKSWTAARLIILFAWAFRPCVIVTTAPTFRQVRDILWREIRASWRRAQMRGYSLGEEPRQTVWRPWPEVLVTGFAVADWAPEHLQGLHAPHVLIVIDEAEGLSPELWRALQSLERGADSHLLMIGNPTINRGPFYESFRDPSFHTMHIAAFDSPNVLEGRIVIPGLVTQENIEDVRARSGESSWEWIVGILGDFPESLENSLISIAQLEIASQKKQAELPSGPVEVGADIARYGADSSVFIARSGGYAFESKSLASRDLMEVTGALVEFARHCGASAIKVDVTGLGAGVVDRLRELHLPVIGIGFGEKPIEKGRFENRAAEMWYTVTEGIREGRIGGPVFKEKELIRDLTSREYSYTSDGRIRLEDKEKMRRKGLPSPDWGDALALAFAAPQGKSDVIAPLGIPREKPWR